MSNFTSTIGMILGLKALVVFGAFLTALYFSVLLYRAYVPGSRFLLAGGIAIGVGILLNSVAYPLGGLAYWPSLFLEATGAIVAAYGFARLTRVVLEYARRQ